MFGGTEIKISYWFRAKWKVSFVDGEYQGNALDLMVGDEGKGLRESEKDELLNK